MINESSHPTSTRDRPLRAPPRCRQTSPDTGPTPTNHHKLLESAQSKIWPETGLDIIYNISKLPSPHISTSKFKFEVTEAAAKHNIRYLQRFDYNLMAALQSDVTSFTSTGSEFRPVPILEPLLKLHPLWDRLKTHLLSGIEFPLMPLSTQARHRDLQDALKFGNHKGVSKFPAFYRQLNIDDIQHGYSIPIPRQDILKIPDALVCPMNVVEQLTISASGELIDKQRACHDLSFPAETSQLSVNSRVIEEELPQCMFGYCLLRLIHYISALRQQFPSTPILIQKVDWKSAYKRIHLNPETAIQCCSTYDNLTLIPLRAIFGGSPCPSEWGIISETTTDLANYILNHEEWDPTTLHSPNQNKIAEPKLLPQSLPFAQTRDMMVQVPLESIGKADVYIDDTITVSLHSETNNAKAAAAVPLAIHTIGRPLLDNEPITRDDLLCLRKLLAEGRLEEVKNTLGWDLNTRSLSVHLPNHKYIAWNQSITKILQAGSTNAKDLETLIGRLTHISVMIPHILHFLGRLRRLFILATKRRQVPLKLIHKEDLELLSIYLQKSHRGIDFNLITFRKPTHAYFSDACPAGLGGYNHRGRAWRFEIPLDLRRRATINMLEHLASIVGPWIDIIERTLTPLSCSISLTDNTTSAGWLRKSNFADDGDTPQHLAAKLQLARSHAARFIEHDIKEYSQWFPGKHNIIADSLSRDFHLSDLKLTLQIRSLLPSQTRQHFGIAPLPPRIVSWIYAWLRQLPANHLPHEAHQPSKIGLGIDGKDSLIPLIYPMTLSSNHLSPPTESRSSPHSPTQFEQPVSLNHQFLDWVKTQSEIPSIMWLRPSGTTNYQTQGSTLTENLHAFYRHNIKHTKTRTLHRNNKRPFQDASSSDYTRTEQPRGPEPSQTSALAPFSLP